MGKNNSLSLNSLDKQYGLGWTSAFLFGIQNIGSGQAEAVYMTSPQ